MKISESRHRRFERGILFELWDVVNALGGYRPTERNYDQGYVDAIGDVLAEIEKAQAASLSKEREGA